jgi:hypothetical protein
VVAAAAAAEWSLINVVDVGCWQRMSKNIKKLKENTSFVSNLAHSLVILNGKCLSFSENVLPDTKRQNLAKKAYLHAEQTACRTGCTSDCPSLLAQRKILYVDQTGQI